MTNSAFYHRSVHAGVGLECPCRRALGRRRAFRDEEASRLWGKEGLTAGRRRRGIILEVQGEEILSQQERKHNIRQE